MVIAGIPCTMPAIWIGLIVIFLIVEGLTAGLVTIWFAVGALAALIAAMFHAPLWLQLVWFFAVSIAAFAVTRPLVKKYINNRTQPTNADMLIGRNVSSRRISTTWPAAAPSPSAEKYGPPARRPMPPSPPGLRPSCCASRASSSSSHPPA